MTTMIHKEWLAATEKIFLYQIGVLRAELADCPYRHWYAGGIASEEVAREALANKLDNMAGIIDSNKLYLD